MTDAPTTLAEHRSHLQRVIDAFNVEITEMEDKLSAMETSRNLAAAELRGIDAAAAAYSEESARAPNSPHPDALGRLPRAPRRDIKALAAAEIAQTPGWTGMSQDERVRFLCKQLRCKPSQAEAAIHGYIQLRDGSMV